MKKFLIPALFFSLTAAGAQTLPEVVFTPVETPSVIQNGSPQVPETGGVTRSVQLPDTPELRTESRLTVPLQGMTLNEALTLLGRNAGLSVLTQNLPSIELRSGLGPMPAGQAIETLLNLYAPGTDAAQVGNLLVIGDAQAVSRVRGMATDAAQSAPQSAVEMFSSPITEEQLSRLGNLIQARALVYSPGTVILSGTREQISQTTELLGRLKEGSGPASEAAIIRKTYSSPNVGSETELLKALFPTTEITGLPNQNVIVVRASSEVQAEIEAALQEERSRSTGLVTAFYPVSYSAEQLASTLRRVQPSAQVSAVEGRNIIMVRATDEQQQLIADTIRELQGGPEANEQKNTDMVSRSIKLGYANAEDLAADLQNIIQPLQDLSLSNQANTEAQNNPNLQVISTTTATTPVLTPAPAPALVSQPAATPATPSLTILADERTNSLLVIGQRSLVNEVVSAIAAIDVPVQSVKVNLAVYQVTNTDVKNLGLNWKASFGGVNFGMDNGGLSLGYEPSLSPASISASLNAKLGKTNTRTLIDSQFTALSGQETKFQNGGELVFRPQSSTTGQNTVQTPAQTYSYGLNITMRPRIAPDGTVVMTMDTTLGNTPGEGPLGSISQSRQALTTTVQIRPGETVVLGGVLTDSTTQGSAGIPGLRDLPVIGPLFGTKTNQVSDTALLFVLTAEEAKPLQLPGRQTVQAQPAPVAVPVSVEGAPNLAPSTPAPLPAATPDTVSPTGVQKTEILPAQQGVNQ